MTLPGIQRSRPCRFIAAASAKPPRNRKFRGSADDASAEFASETPNPAASGGTSKAVAAKGSASQSAKRDAAKDRQSRANRLRIKIFRSRAGWLTPDIGSAGGCFPDPGWRSQSGALRAIEYADGGRISPHNELADCRVPGDGRAECPATEQ
jgi:hypothetical protein